MHIYDPGPVFVTYDGGFKTQTTHMAPSKIPQLSMSETHINQQNFLISLSCSLSLAHSLSVSLSLSLSGSCSGSCLSCSCSCSYSAHRDAQ